MRTLLQASTLAVLVSVTASRPAQAEAPQAEAPQAPPSKNTVFAEFVGAGLGFTANYDRNVLSWLSVRGGLGYSFSTGIGSGEYANFVVSASGLYSLGGAHHLEVSPGVGMLKEIGDDRSASALSLLGGYRYQRQDGGLFGRVQLGAAIFNRSDRDAKTIALFGLAVGWTL